MIRLFAALFPSDAAREHLVTAFRPIRDFSPQEVRWTDPDNWHITLAFYGDQPNDAGAVREHLAQVSAFHRPIDLCLSGAGAFEQRTLWVGTGGQTGQLRELMAECLLPEDTDQRARQRAHLTVGRTARRSQDPYFLGDVVRALAVYRGPEFTCEEISLVQSHLGQGRGGGPRYEVIDTFSLRGLA